MNSIDGIMNGLGLFGGSGAGGGALGGIFNAMLKMLYRSVLAGSLAYLGLGGQIGPIVDSIVGAGGGYLSGAFNPETPPPLVTLDQRIQYGLERSAASLAAVKGGANTAAGVVAQMKNAAAMADAIEGELANPDGTIHAIQNVGAASLLTYSALERNNALQAAKLNLELRREDERRTAREQAIKQAEAFFPTTGNRQIAADTFTFHPTGAN